MSEIFRKFASRVSKFVGTSQAFVIAVSVILIWVLTGPLFGFSDDWLLIINTFTTVSTFLIVFLIQNTQNRDSKATHLKLDELIRAVKGAKNQLLDIEHVSDQELEDLQQYYQELHKHYEAEMHKRRSKSSG